MIEYILCYAWAFTLGSIFGAGAVLYLFYLQSKGKI
jgi:hypothetical protein